MHYKMATMHGTEMTSLVFFIIIVGVACDGHALHTSWAQIDQLWKDEAEAIARMRTTIHSLNKLNEVLNRYVASWEELAGSSDFESRSGDPAAAYSLLHHVSRGWRHVDPLLQEAKGVFSDIEHLASRADRELLPNAEDLIGASESLARLAHVYRLNTTELARGGLSTAVDQQRDSAQHTLSMSDLANIGLVAINKGFFGVAVEFLRAARSRADIHAHTALQAGFGGDYTPQRLDDLINTAVRVHDHVLAMRGPRSLTHATAPRPYAKARARGTATSTSELSEVVVGTEFLKRHVNSTWMRNYRQLVELQQVERLCRGEDLRPAEVTSQLTCSYMAGSSTWLLLAPFKVEVLSQDPYITIVYEVMKPREAEEVKAKAGHLLQTPHNAAYGNSENGTQSGWTLKHTWLQGKDESTLRNLGLRLGQLIDVVLDDAVSEPYMVANYGMGGTYEAHRDTHGPARRPHSPVAGERLATLLTYVEAPRAGGRTVFPWVGAGVTPAEGATVIWWNLLASHEHDFLTRHAACPVLRGHKWIINKWVGYKAQWRKHPCPADPARKMQLPCA
ncbi:prolyl 4-hydroxylase subunit alpha-1-like [Penaeus japonicus]|uniref:prolyl 4-hydroxylase subunit alpha-1-like n=1 Tax=Penaeus japonicus TaxID=27405 RepID=UPI001C70B4D7|nr:prolyl 4-hydroxylase subunit alpha-1-like [Penaeus japonicus]